MDYLDSTNKLVTAAEPRWITSPKRIRAFLGGECVVDSVNAKLLRRAGPPQYFFDKADCRPGALVETKESVTDRVGTFVKFDVHSGSNVAKDGAFEYQETAKEFQFLLGFVSFRWPSMTAWFEEDEEVFVHARDPFKRIEAVSSLRQVQIIHNGQHLAESRSSVLLIEPGHPLRYYLPKHDVTMDAFVPSETISMCPYKGQANYYSLQTLRGFVSDIAWVYRYPIPEASKVAGMMCFYNEKVDSIVVDGQEIPKPVAARAR